LAHFSDNVVFYGHKYYANDVATGSMFMQVYAKF